MEYKYYLDGFQLNGGTKHYSLRERKSDDVVAQFNMQKYNEEAIKEFHKRIEFYPKLKETVDYILSKNDAMEMVGFRELWDIVEEIDDYNG